MKKLLQTVRLIYVKIGSRFDRGRSQFGRFIDFGQISIMIGLGIDLWNNHKNINLLFVHFTLPEIPFSWLPIGMISFAILWFIWGHLDQKYLHIQQEENAYNTRFLNPHLNKIDEIEKIVKKLYEKLS